MERTHSPSDLSLQHLGAELTLGGRLVNAKADTLTLSDALGACDVRLRAGSAIPHVGNWVQVRGTVAKNIAVKDTAVKNTAAHATPRDVSPPAHLELYDAVIVMHSPGELLPDGYSERFGRIGRLLAARARASAATRRFFDARGFVEVSTPVRVAAPGTDVYLEPQPSEERWLITSPEFHHKRLLAGGLPRIYELAHCTRKGERGTWHHSEFTMLEWYAAFTSVDDLMQQTEALVRHVAAELAVGPKLCVHDRSVDLAKPFLRLTVADAFQEFAGVDDVVRLAAHDEDRYFQLMVDLVDPAIAKLPVPVFLTHYPESQAALARRSATAPGFAERFELFIGGIELCNGYGELTDADEQAARFALDVERRAHKGLPRLPIDDGLIRALREGVPPCSGNAVGFDRLLAVLLGERLDDVVAFPP